SLCTDRIGPSMQTLQEGPEPIFTDPYDPERSVFQRLIDLRFADSLQANAVCAFLRKYDLLMVLPAGMGGFSIRVLTVRRASSLEELEHWRATFEAMPEVSAAALVRLWPWVFRRLEDPEVLESQP
ncbi:MAG TPA: hypothetical protein VF037_05555, partial [Gemmatimonadales bacterium]